MRIPVQQSPAPRGGNYGSLPGINASIGRPDVSSGKVNRGIYGQYEQFKPKQSSALSPSQAAAPYNAAANALGSLGNKMMQHKAAVNARVQDAVDHSARVQSDTNLTSYYSKTRSELNQTTDLEQFDSIVESTSDASDIMWNDVDKGELSDGTLESIDLNYQKAQAKFGIVASEMRQKLKIRKAKAQLEGIIDQSLVTGEKQKGLDSIKSLSNLGHITPEEAKNRENQYLNKFAYHEGYMKARQDPRSIIDNDAIYDKDKFPRLTGNQRDNIFNIADNQIRKKTEVAWIVDQDKAVSGMMTELDMERAAKIYTPQRFETLKIKNRNAVIASEQKRKKAQADMIKRNTNTARGLEKTVIRISKERFREHEKMLEEGTDSVMEIRSDNHLTMKQQDELIKRLGVQKQIFMNLPEYEGALNTINRVGKDYVSRDAAASSITSLRDDYNAPDSVVVDLIDLYNRNIKRAEQKDDKWFGDNSRRVIEIEALDKLNSVYDPVFKDGGKPAEAFGLFQHKQEELISFMDEAQRTPEEIDSKIKEITAPVIRDYMLESVGNVWATNLKPDREEGLEYMYLELEKILSPESLESFKAGVRRGVPINVMMSQVKQATSTPTEE